MLDKKSIKKQLVIIGFDEIVSNKYIDIINRIAQKVEENKTKQSTASIIEAIRKDFSNSTVTAKFKTAA